MVSFEQGVHWTHNTIFSCINGSSKLIELSVHLVFVAVGFPVDLVMIIILTHDYQELKLKICNTIAKGIIFNIAQISAFDTVKPIRRFDFEPFSKCL